MSWHGKEREIRYRPYGEDFVITNGNRRFNRALYGTHSGFRVEAGDLPEFALYLPGMGGNLKFGLMAEDTSLWLIDAKHITARYRPGSMIYEVQDSIIGRGTLHLSVIPLDRADGMVIKIRSENMNPDTRLLWAFGGANGKRFNREGDIGADPESVFYLKPEYCVGNQFTLEGNTFLLSYRSVRTHAMAYSSGFAPPGGDLRICDARAQDSPYSLYHSTDTTIPVVTGMHNLPEGQNIYFCVSNTKNGTATDYESSPKLFDNAEKSRAQLAGRIYVETPDPYVNTIGGALAAAADAIWEDPSYLHGAVAWRMRLNGWRGAYAGDWLGWHDRAERHLEGYARAQYDSPASGPNVPDPKTNLARQLEERGVSLFTEGYISRNPDRISRPHHYDMNLIFIDQLLWHIRWTGDLEFARRMWPVITRHLEWEKRCFDGDNDGLYDAYCCIWASDALQYSGGGVTHSSAYNFRANLITSQIAEKIGEDPELFRREADRIIDAVNRHLWIPETGHYAEYKDLLGLRRVHPSAGLWTIYHAMDAGLPDPFQAWQSLHYIDLRIPHIPIRAGGLPEGEYYTLSTTNWMPYTWSINNVALPENLHTALAYWQGNRADEAFRLWKSQMLESMYLGASPGNFQQLSFYDAFRGELYRDFADPVGMAARTLVEGLFGITPDAVEGTLLIKPGWPSSWKYASLRTPDVTFEFKQKGRRDHYAIIQNLSVKMNLIFRIPARKTSIQSVKVNGQHVKWSNVDQAVGRPLIEFNAGLSPEYDITIDWKGTEPETAEKAFIVPSEEVLEVAFDRARIRELYDPQGVVKNVSINDQSLVSGLKKGTGHHTLFLNVEQECLSWWVPVEIEMRKPFEITACSNHDTNRLRFRIRNNTGALEEVTVMIPAGEDSFQTAVSVPPNAESEEVIIPPAYLVPGSNRVTLKTGRYASMETVVNWNIETDETVIWEPVGIEYYLNDHVNNIFKNKYLSPRSPYPTLQLPIQGIGDWCSYNKTASIDDSGLRERAGKDDLIVLKQGIPLITPGIPEERNILFTSLWDNYPDEVTLPLSGKSSHAYFLMAGSTHHMQSRIANGEIVIEYSDRSLEKLELINPDTWWPIEQDYYMDDYAFKIEAVRPPRIHLKSGLEPEKDYEVLSRNNTIPIDGGAATLFDLPLDPGKELKSLTLRTLSNDVVIGLMGVTLIR
ncbi:MAG: DUF4450 domain-containing protein [Bacteroidales bacterium]|nr:DUF4450 domain-containing protein [Bacteroidales bacterium]MBN2698402.1 DUF4450 domain-containing protein [Bacteroidales bacterium]